MAHFAQLDENNIVTQVIVLGPKSCCDHNGTELEMLGIAHCKRKYGVDTNWVQTSYNNNIRANYAGVGFTYDSENDVFIPPKPFPSWVLDSNYQWVSPVGYATTLTQAQIDAGQSYLWDEDTQSWILTTS